MSISNVLDFNTLVANQVAAMQAASGQILDFTPGSILLAIAESNASVAIWLQSQFLQVLATTRASTSAGTDLDTFVADYGLSRIPATVATGHVTFSRFSPSQQAVVPVGSSVQSTDGTETYQVTIDTSNAAYDSTQAGYILPISTQSVTVPVSAITPGTSGNAAIGAISVITSPIPSVDTVTNAAALTNGMDAETDVALRIRFIEFIASLDKGTYDAVAYAIISAQPGMTYSIIENYLYDGTLTNGHFYVVVDDGTGAPTSDLLTKIQARIEAVRPLGSSFEVYAPVIESANVTMTLSISAGNPAAIRTAVQTAITNYINTLTLGTTLTYTVLAQIAYNTTPLITNVTAITLNGGTADLTATPKQVIKAGTVTIN